MLSALEGGVAKLEGSMGDVRETLKEADGHTTKLKSRKDQLKEQVAEALNTNIFATNKEEKAEPKSETLKLGSMILNFTKAKRDCKQKGLMFVDINIAGQRRGALIDTRVSNLFISKKVVASAGVGKKLAARDVGKWCRLQASVVYTATITFIRNVPMLPLYIKWHPFGLYSKEWNSKAACAFCKEQCQMLFYTCGKCSFCLNIKCALCLIKKAMCSRMMATNIPSSSSKIIGMIIPSSSV
ncbi:hypothetical protein Gotur_023566 [Gossypium turneri]